MVQADRNVFDLLADVLEYPTTRIAGQAEECILALESVSGKAKGHFEAFSIFCRDVPVNTLEEVYTETFDLQALCSPYVGYHLFGEDHARGMFMVKLKEHYLKEDYFVNGELPDHISIMLRYLSVTVRGDETRDLINLCLIPAVKKMIPLFKDSGNPYQGVLQATLKALETERDRS